MKFNFKKISAVLGSFAMVGATLGFAAAAAYPAPFVQSGSANVAIVYGTGQGVSSLDMVQAQNIKTSLASYVIGTGNLTGENMVIEKTTDKFNLGDSASTVFSTSIDDDDLPELLAEGTYTDDDNTEYDYTQKITLGSNLGLEHFKDSDYNNNEPAIGIKMGGSEHVFNYTLDFTTHPAYNASTMETTTLTLLGKEYYVLDVVGFGDGTTNLWQTTLLDTAVSAVVSEGETVTLSGKTVSIVFISSTEVRLDVSGQQTNSLAEGATYKLSDGTYVGIKDILFDSRDGQISKVELSLGKGKLELPHRGAIELNDVSIEEVVSFMENDSSYKLDKIVLQWTTDDEEFIGPDSELTLPGFESVKFSMGAFVQPKQEVTKVENSGSDVMELKTTIESGTVTIPLLKADTTGALASLGKDTSNRLVTTTVATIMLNETAGDKYLVASYNTSDDSESYYLEFDVTTEDTIPKVRFKDIASGDDWVKVTNASDTSFGSVTLTVINITDSGTDEWANISINSGGSFHELYTKEGLKVYLPYYAVTLNDEGKGALNYTNGTEGGVVMPYVRTGIYNGSIVASTNTGYGNDSWYMFFAEEDKDDDLAQGNIFNITVDESGTSNKIHISDINTAASEHEIGDTDNFESYVISDLATRALYKTGGDQDTVEITYAGSQSYGQLYLAVESATSTGELGDVLVMDSEVDSVASKNLIIVGGSCINSAAATALGGAYCGASFTTATGVSAGQFLIKGVQDAFSTGKLALVIAGYDAADTQNAATYLVNKDVDTSEAYKGTSATSAELIVE